MDIKTLFETYKILVSNKIGSKEIFEKSGMVDKSKILDFGFFPLGSGILTETKSEIKKAAIEENGTLILGNDFGTITYLETKCKNNREKNSKTIDNLLKLELNLETTFFTNFYLGLRNDQKHLGTTMTKRVVKLQQDYKDLCNNFFDVQLSMLEPRTIICLGSDVGQTLSEYSKLFKTFSKKYSTISNLYADENKKEYIVNIDDNQYGKRKFILIPHPSFGHINWKKNYIEEKIKAALQN